jgi:hypothetical protein
MKVKMLKQYIVYKAGETADLPNGVALELIRRKIAVEAKKGKK